MIDQKTATKRAYDLAAEALIDHALICDGCTLTRDKLCEVGRPLVEAENVAWTAYREARQ